jgi:hypothetical protein
MLQNPSHCLRIVDKKILLAKNVDTRSPTTKIMRLLPHTHNKHTLVQQNANPDYIKQISLHYPIASLVLFLDYPSHTAQLHPSVWLAGKGSTTKSARNSWASHL